MADVERNLDAYRILSEILGNLRTVLRTEIEKRHGKEWYRVGLPQTVRERLIERKEREQAIDWYESEYQQLMDFASFADILEILEANPDLLPGLKAVTPSAPLLHARMMELEVIREKLAMARSISDTELSFLATFHVRIRKALGSTDGPSSSPAETKQPELHVVADPPEVEEPPRTVPESTGTMAASTDGEEKNTPEKSEPKRSKLKTKTRVGRSRTFGGSPTSAPGAAAVQTTIIAEEELDEDEPEPEQPQPEAAPPADNALLAALDAGDSRVVLRTLYKEVTGLAEAIWNSDAALTPAVWPRVREHGWYEENFTTLGLKPLSDFYEILGRVRETIRAGTSKDELQAFLKEQNFAKVLLALRDMFQKNEI